MSSYYDKNKSRWVFDFDKVIKGHRVRATKTLPEGWNRSKAQAFDKAETDRLYAIATGATKERVMIAAAVTLYIKHQCPLLKNGDGVIKELARIYWAYDGKYLDELAEVGREYTAAAVRIVKDKDGNETAEPLSPATIKNKLSYLRAACRYAQKHHDLGIGESFVIAMPAVRNERQVYADRRAMLQIARQCTDRYARAMVRVAFYSGMRLSEMILIDSMADQLFRLQDTKNGEPRFVPAHPRVFVCAKYFPLPCKKRWYQRLIRAAMDAAGFPDLRLHDIRHSTASAMVNAGVDLFTIGKVLGHKDGRSTARYSHLSIETLTAAIGKIGQRMTNYPQTIKKKAAS